MCAVAGGCPHRELLGAARQDGNAEEGGKEAPGSHFTTLGAQHGVRTMIMGTLRKFFIRW
jgi:hypothetical protein